MLAKKYRLPIQTVLNKSGRTFRSRSFLIKSFLNQLDYNRFGVVISKKVDKLAVKRNRLKRIVLDATKKFVSFENKTLRPHSQPSPSFLLRPAMRGFGGQVGGQAGQAKQDILIIISPVMVKMEKADIIKELEDCLQKLF